jgi:hypothetical protein
MVNPVEHCDRRISIACAGGIVVTVELVAVVGPMGVTRAVDDEGWRITHLASGIAFPYRFRASHEALDVLQECDRLLDWDEFNAAIAVGERPAVLEQVKRVCRDHGGYKKYDDRATNNDAFVGDRLAGFR